jgi:hypothetical protein
VANEQPECAKVLAQIQESLLAIKHHFITYQLQILQVSLGRAVEITNSKTGTKLTLEDIYGDKDHSEDQDHPENVEAAQKLNR